MEKEAHKWELEKVEEVEEEELTTLLLVRKSRTEKNDSNITENSTVNLGVNDKLISESNGQAIQSTVTENGAHKDESTLGNDEKIEKPDGIVENEAENLVIFDKDEGVGHGKMEILSQSYKTSEETESAEIDRINEGEEYDVETVLQKQQTHDLYCPNCNSCITRRVILSKRKRTKVQSSYKEVKRNKVDNPSVQGSDDQVHLHHHIGVEEDVDHDSGPDLFRCLSCFSFFIPTGNGFKLFHIFGDKSRKENDQDEQVPRKKKNWFTSIFASNNQDTLIEQDAPSASEPLLVTVENDDTWKCEDKILLSPKHELSTSGLVVITGKIDAKTEQHEVVAGYHLKEPVRGKEQVEVAVGYHLKEPIISKDQFEVFSSYHLKEPVRSKEQVEVVAGYHLKEPVKSKDQTEVVSCNHLKEPIRSNEQVEVVVGYHLKEPIISKDVQVTSGSDIVVTTLINTTEIFNEEPAEDAISFPRKGGSDVVISSNDGSKATEKSEEGQILIQTTQKGSPGKVCPTEVSQQVTTKTILEVQTREPLKVDSILSIKGNDTLITIDAHPVSEIVQDIVIPEETAIPTHTTTQNGIPVEERAEEVRRSFKIEVIKSIVYGGLAESITSLSVVSSAAGGDAATLNILALGMANLIGGFFVICHNLWELRCERADQVTDQKDRYKELLGRRQNFKLHAIVCVLSYLVFGLTPIIVYGFSFREMDKRELKLMVVGAVSLLCIVALSIGKAYVCRPPKAYIKTVVNFVILGFMASGISYAAGVLVKRLLEELGLFQSTSVADMIVNGTTSKDSTWASY